MARIAKVGAKKKHADNLDKTKLNSDAVTNKSISKKDIQQHLMHPDYILFDWEFFSRELEFE